MMRSCVIGITALIALMDAAVALPKASKNYESRIRPRGHDQEDREFWNTFAKNDLKRQLDAGVNNGVAKNVIIFVGDGMGVSTVTMSRIYKGQRMGKSGEEEEIVWEAWPNTGISKTYNTNFQVADSAGTATALFSGVKTSLGVIGVDALIPRNSCDADQFEKSKLKGMLHWAVDAGKETGIVTSTRLTHATPASLYANSPNRDWESDSDEGCFDDIAKQLIHGDIGKKVNVILGGGRREFLPLSLGGHRKSGNLVEDFKALKDDEGKTFKYLETASDLKEWVTEGTTDHVLGLFSSSHMDYMTDRPESNDPQPTLSQMTEAALERLKDAENGFFLMVEGGRIDHAHHDNFVRRAMEETMELERAVKVVMDKMNMDETLVIVTADHSHSVTINGYPKRGNNILGYSYDPPYAVSHYETGEKLSYATISYANGMGFYNHFTSDSVVPWKDFKDFTESQFENPDFKHPAMMPPPEESETHGGEDVAIYAIGPMSHLLTGVHEQNYIAHVMAYSACVGDYKDDCDRSQRGNAGSPIKPFFSLLMVCGIFVRLRA